MPVVAGGLYEKAPIGGRLGAVIADSLIASALLPTGILLIYAGIARGQMSIAGIALSVIGGLWQVGYLLGRDAAGGGGFGKRMTGLVVTSVATGAPAPAGATILRQVVLFALGLVPAVGSLIEPVMVLVDKEGRRVGDKAAKTQVARATDLEARGIAVNRAKGLAIGVLVAATLLNLIGSSVAGFVFARAVAAGPGGSVGIDSIAPTITPEAPVTQPETPAALAPEDTVKSFYAAVSSADLDAVKALFSEETAPYIDAGFFEGWSNPDYEILGTTEPGPGITNVTVQETDGGVTGGNFGGLVTFILVDENGWKIDDWTIDNSGESGDADGADASSGAVVNPETAVDAVGNLLNELKENNVDVAKTYTTRDFQTEYDWFLYPAGGALFQFEVIENYQDAATWIVRTSEEWNSGPEEVTYVVIEEDGRAKVNAVIHDNY